MTIPSWLDSVPAVRQRLTDRQARWLVTGAAGFIGSHLVETLLDLDQIVIGLDNFSTGRRENLADVRVRVGEVAWERFTMIEGDIRDPETCLSVTTEIDHILHQAALGSVPRSIADPLASNASNITGFVNMLDAARRTGNASFVYAASSSTYGDEPNLPKREERIGNPLSPYAVTKLVNEIYASVFARSYGFKAIGLRYFNVFGPRQDPNGAYAAVIPRWIAAMIAGREVQINGDGETSRDFCFIDNAVQANILASLADDDARDAVYNVAFGERTSLTSLFEMIRVNLADAGVHYGSNPVYRNFRTGDVRHSLADISKARAALGYAPQFSLRDGLDVTVRRYVAQTSVLGA